MKLPNAEHSVVPERKIVSYLLSGAYPRGKHKARVFRGRGFAISAWDVLAQSLRHHAMINEVAVIAPTPLGERFVIEGIMETPIGKSLNIRSVWFIDHGESIPRFVTAYPLRRGGI